MIAYVTVRTQVHALSIDVCFVQSVAVAIGATGEACLRRQIYLLYDAHSSCYTMPIYHDSPRIAARPLPEGNFDARTKAAQGDDVAGLTMRNHR